MVMRIKKVMKFLRNNERYLSPLALFVGFIFDNITLKRIDLWSTNFILFSYLAVAGICIVFIQLYKNKKSYWKVVRKIEPILPIVLQFVFGGLFSGYLLFFSRSAPLVVSWFFVLLLLSLLIGNEFFRKHYEGLVFQISIFYFSLFSFAIFFIPVMLGKMGMSIFLLSGFMSLVIIAILLFCFSLLMPKRIKNKMNIITISIASIFIAINFLYFTNIIPPVPISIKDVGVYHLVVRNTDGKYLVNKEVQKWWKFGILGNKIHIQNGEPVYVYSSVFAPTNLNIKILHKWQYYDKTKDKWVTLSTVLFPIVGGRDSGYRGYSFKRNVFPGKWRVDVTTERGQIIGRISFDIIFSKNTPVLITEYK